MTQAAFGGSIFNAEVELWLTHEDGCIKLRQAGAEFVIAEDGPRLLPQSRVSLAVAVDGKVHERDAILVDGILPGQPRSRIVACDADGLPF